MEGLTSYHAKLIEIASELVNHGYGQCTIDVCSMKDESVRIIIMAGKHYVFFIKKEIVLDKNMI